MTQIGTVIEGKYEILKQIGQGGMSVVYLAMDKRLNKQWAVKEIKKQANDKNNEIVIQSMITEANLIKRLDHPALPRIVDIIDNGQTLYIVMDYIEGEPLDRILDEYGAQPQELVIEWAKQLCDVLDYLHTRTPAIIYRDMKPHNVMLKPEGNVKLIDFGIAREYKEQNLADTVSLGTKGYAAPEQFGGKGQTDPRTDVYCLGVTLYHLVTGHNPAEPPYELYPIRHWNPSLSGGLERIIQKCTQLNPNDRYQSCAELMYALNHYEEVDDVYRKKQKKKLVGFICSAILTVILGISSVTCLAVSSKMKSSSYDHLISEGTQESYIQAASVDPARPDAYLNLVKLFKSNGKLKDNGNQNDDAGILTSLGNNLGFDQLKANNENYANVCYQFGTAFWFYDDSDQALHVQATKWFANIVAVPAKTLSAERQKDRSMAETFQKIGSFYSSEVTWNKEGGVPANAYKDYWNSINQLLSSDDGSNQFVTIKIMDEVVRESVLRQSKLNVDGITNDQIVTVINQVKNKLSNMKTTDNDISKRKHDLLILCDLQLKLLQ